MTENWQIFNKDHEPHDGIKNLPEPPPWRSFNTEVQTTEKKSRALWRSFNNEVQTTEKKSREEIKGKTFQVWDEQVKLVNAALYLRRPLLVTGKPGTGKSSLAYAIAYQLKLGKVLTWPINTRTTLSDGLYRYDAIGRLQDAQLGNQPNIGKYIQLGAVGTAFLPNEYPRVLLIDEIDKSDIDLPNDLLNLFEEGEFEIPELARISSQKKVVNVGTYDNQKVNIYQGKVACQQFPLVIMTSNGERDFPPAFLRRCLQLEMPEPTRDQLDQIVKSHFDNLESDTDTLNIAKEFIEKFVREREGGKNLATDQLLNVIFMLTKKKSPSEQDKKNLLECLLKSLDRR